MSSFEQIEELSWPAPLLGTALEALAREGGLAQRGAEAAAPPREVARAGGDALGRWIQATAAWLGFEAEPTFIRYADVEEILGSDSPVLITLPREGEPRFLALARSRGRGARLIAPDLSVRAVPLDALRDAICRKAEAPLSGETERLLEEVGVPRRRRARARRAILGQRLVQTWLGECWHLRPAPGASAWAAFRHARLPRRLISLVAAHVAQYALWLISWWVIGRAVIGGRLDAGWLAAWALLLLTTIPLRLLATWSAGLFAVGAGGLLKQRLIYGALRLEPEEVRHEGVGHLLGRVFEGEAVETLALGGGLLGVVASVELLIGALVLGVGAGGVLHVALLLAWVSALIYAGWRYYRKRLVWTEARLNLTHDLVEVMAGYRTRLAQEEREHWHDGEDQALERYLGLSASLDRAAARLIALAPRGWLVLALCCLAPAFVYGSASTEALAVSLGGIILVFRALEKLAESMASLAGAGIAWRQVAPLFRAASRPEQAGVPAFAVAARGGGNVSSDGDGARVETPTAVEAPTVVEVPTVVEAHDVGFRYGARGEPILRNCELHIAAGERLLLEGASGGGKSTFASLLTGMRAPESGLLLVGGLDRQTLGLDGWRRRVASAPQFHENHVMTETFSFNLLMGRRWPPRREDLAEAEAVCRELGLGDLLSRMPGGFEQMVGESGWQLSHGERSRLFIARTLLQDADLLVLDESFAALDPENLRLALACVLRRAPSLLVIAHP